MHQTHQQTALADLLFDKLPKKQTFEAELWAVADNLRANAKLEPSAYKAPVLALLFLRYAYVKFEAAYPEIEKQHAARGLRAKPIEEMCQTECGFFLPEIARYPYLLYQTQRQHLTGLAPSICYCLWVD